jgi:hypothetical protein
MRCDPWAFLLARNLASPCLGREPKVRVATPTLYPLKGIDKVIEFSLDELSGGKHNVKKSNSEQFF